MNVVHLELEAEIEVVTEGLSDSQISALTFEKIQRDIARLDAEMIAAENAAAEARNRSFSMRRVLDRKREIG